MEIKRLFWVVLVVCSVLSSCNHREKTNGINSSSYPNILFIVSEDNGPELGCYGNREVSTPNIDRLAKEGLLFENAFVTYSVCSPSRATLFTGLYPHQNGQIGLATHQFSMYDSLETLPEILKQAGYRAGIIGKLHVNPESSFSWDYQGIKGNNFGKKDLFRYTEEALDFINQDPKTPFFVMVNFPDAHFPLQAQVDGLPEIPLKGDGIDQPLPFIGADSPRLREFTANYYNSMNRLDIGVGMLMDSLEKKGLLENTIVIYMGDHGPQFSRAKCSNYEAGLRVPLIIKSPYAKATKGKFSSNLVSSIDILPTLMDIAGVTRSDLKLPGRSLLPLLEGNDTEPWREYVFAGGNSSTSLLYYPRRSVRGKRYKLIHNLLYERENPKFAYYTTHANSHFDGGTETGEIEASNEQIQAGYATWKNPTEYELYDLQNDPFEWNNLIEKAEMAQIKEELIQKLEEWQLQTQDPLRNKEILDRFTAEIDSVNVRFPNHSYTRDTTFRWGYHHYFK